MTSPANGNTVHDLHTATVKESLLTEILEQLRLHDAAAAPLYQFRKVLIDLREAERQSMQNIQQFLGLGTTSVPLSTLTSVQPSTFTGVPATRTVTSNDPTGLFVVGNIGPNGAPVPHPDDDEKVVRMVDVPLGNRAATLGDSTEVFAGTVVAADPIGYTPTPDLVLPVGWKPGQPTVPVTSPHDSNQFIPPAGRTPSLVPASETLPPEGPSPLQNPAPDLTPVAVIEDKVVMNDASVQAIVPALSDGSTILVTPAETVVVPKQVVARKVVAPAEPDPNTNAG